MSESSAAPGQSNVSPASTSNSARTNAGTSSVTNKSENKIVNKTESVSAASNNYVKKTTRIAKPKEKNHINFPAGSSNVTKVSSAFIQEINEFFKTNTDKKIIVNGYASSEGDLDINMQLSQERAKSVRDYLVRKGIPSDKVETVGKGVESPIADNETLEGRMQNRRAEIIFQ